MSEVCPACKTMHLANGPIEGFRRDFWNCRGCNEQLISIYDNGALQVYKANELPNGVAAWYAHDAIRALRTYFKGSVTLQDMYNHVLTAQPEKLLNP
jgi:hypothetical protein